MIDYNRLRDIVRGGVSTPSAPRELTYEPVTGHEVGVDPAYVGAVLGGRPITTAVGPCLAIDRRYEGDRWHGRMRVAECRVEDGETLGVLDPHLPAAGGAEDPSRIVFVDLETTGLSGGAGTVAFLVGCGYYDLDAFQVRQFLLTSFAGERALLAAVADFVGPAALVVTFNGKTFDLPVMETRWLFHRMETPFAGKRHFDMLHVARRLWREREEDGGCSLGELERRIVGFERRGDVPGFEIPGRYFQFLRSGDPRPLEAVLEHNRLDLISLAAVVARGMRLVEGGAEVCGDARETLAVGKVLERAGRTEPALACYRMAAAGRSPRVRAESLCRGAVLLRRERRFDEAADRWQEVVEIRGGGTQVDAARRQALEALAIHHEHRAGDLPAARSFALEAMHTDPCPRWQQAVRHRLDRLDRKLARVHEKGGREAAPLIAHRPPGPGC
jgi:hypothetical protein